MRWILIPLLASQSYVSAQTKSTQAEIDQWKKETAILESSACKKITWLLETEPQGIRSVMGWWGRGYIEGAAFVMGDDAVRKADKFGLSVDVVAAHVATYCYEHPAETAFDAVRRLLVKVLK